MPNKLNDFFNNENITIMLREDLQHILTSFHNRGKSSLEYISDDLRKIHGAKPTDLRLLENIRVLEGLGLVEFENRTSLYLLTEKGHKLYQ